MKICIPWIFRANYVNPSHDFSIELLLMWLSSPSLLLINEIETTELSKQTSLAERKWKTKKGRKSREANIIALDSDWM